MSGVNGRAAAGPRARLKALVKQAIPQRLVCRRGWSSKNEVGLTFDDGPFPGRTEQVLDLLERWDASATFFVIGQRVLEHPELARRIEQQGHELGNHTYSHPYFDRLDARSIWQEIRRGDEAIAAVTGAAPRRFRPPCGSLSLRLFWRLLASSRLPVLLWTHAVGGDESIYRPSRAEVLEQWAACGARPGDILLLHDTNEQTIEALPAILADLQRRGLRGVAVGQLLERQGRAT